jgi:hypothetical protein
MSNAEIDHYLNFLESTVEKEHQAAIEAIKASLEQVKQIAKKLLTLTSKELIQENESLLDEYMKTLDANVGKLEPSAYKEQQEIYRLIFYSTAVKTVLTILKELANKKNNMSSIRKAIDETISGVYFYLGHILDKKTEQHYNQNTELGQKKLAFYKKLDLLLDSIKRETISVQLLEVEQFFKTCVRGLELPLNTLQKSSYFASSAKV